MSAFFTTVNGLYLVPSSPVRELDSKGSSINLDLNQCKRRLVTCSVDLPSIKTGQASSKQCTIRTGA